MNQAVTRKDGLPDPFSTPLNQLDVADPRRFEFDTWQPLFERLRSESPIPYQAEGPGGPAPHGDFWSVTRFEDIVEVEKNWEAFSSEPSIAILDPEPDMSVQMFIATDPPLHDDQRRAVQGAVAPRNLQESEAVIRQRTQGGIVRDGGDVRDRLEPQILPPRDAYNGAKARRQVHEIVERQNGAQHG